MVETPEMPVVYFFIAVGSIAPVTDSRIGSHKKAVVEHVCISAAIPNKATAVAWASCVCRSPLASSDVCMAQISFGTLLVMTGLGA